MKTDAITFSTNRSMQEIVNILREAAGKFRANIEKLEDDPFGAMGGQTPGVAVLMDGQVSLLGMKGARCWGVQIYVSDLGNARSVELVALGDGMGQAFSGGAFYGLGDSKKKRDQIASMIS